MSKLGHTLMYFSELSISSSVPMAELSEWVLLSRGTESRQGCRSIRAVVGPVGVDGILQPSKPSAFAASPFFFFLGADCNLCKHLTRLADSQDLIALFQPVETTLDRRVEGNPVDHHC